MSATRKELIAGPNEPPWTQTLTGQKIRVRTPGKETGGQVTVIEYVEQPHTAPPVYTKHEFVELFCVQEGTLTFKFLDEDAFEAPAGTVITCPRWKPHSFWNRSDEPVRALLVCSPAGLEDFFAESMALLERLPPDTTPADELKAAQKALRDRFGLLHIGPPPEDKL
ncbi:MAG: cupin domain-containing protein [Anaerolineales bacterium]|nr:cupin domain-containing protein [Anaerolineales bacterium]